jgi:hypothetical protein
LHWLEEVYLPKVEVGSLLLIDKWGGWKRPMESEEVQAKKVSIHFIPEGTTGEIQPLDVFYNRQFKTFIRSLSNLIRRRNPDYILSVRFNLVNLISLIHHQFCAPRFREFVKYAWFASGYGYERPAAFRSPPQYCLKDFPPSEKCKCGAVCLVRCGYCEEFLCFDHFVVDRHRCA